MTDLHTKISEIVTQHGPRYLIQGMSQTEALERIIETFEVLLNRIKELEAKLPTNNGEDSQWPI